MEVAPPYPLLQLFTLLTRFHCLYYRIETALHCFNSSIYALVIGKVRTLLEWADGLLSKERF